MWKRERCDIDVVSLAAKKQLRRESLRLWSNLLWSDLNLTLLQASIRHFTFCLRNKKLPRSLERFFASNLRHEPLKKSYLTKISYLQSHGMGKPHPPSVTVVTPSIQLCDLKLSQIHSHPLHVPFHFIAHQTYSLGKEDVDFTI